MIDTVTLSLPKGVYKIITPDDFKPSFEPINYKDDNQVNEFLRVHKGSLRYDLKSDLKSREWGKVYPSVSIYEIYWKEHEEYSCNLKITFSCPKLLWGKSFIEVRDKNFTQVINLLAIRLKEIDVIVSPSDLRTALATRIDYCRNTKFSSMNHARTFLNRLRKCAFPKLETDLTRFANNGKAVRFHSDLFEVIFYLKYYDLLEPLRKAVDRRRTKQEIAKAKELQKKKQIPSVVRMETRFIGKSSVNSHLASTIGIIKDKWTFEEIFKEAFSNRVRKHYWEAITSDPRNYAILTQPTDEDVCRKVLQEFKKQRPKGIFEGLGLFYILKTLGVPELKTIFTEQWNEDTWFAKRNAIATFAANYLKPKTMLIDPLYNGYTKVDDQQL